MSQAILEGESSGCGLPSWGRGTSAVLEAFLARGDEAAGVICAPQKPGVGLDPLSATAGQAGIGVFASPRCSEEARRAPADLKTDIAIRAYVLQVVPQDYAAIPAHGSIQFHPSLQQIYDLIRGCNPSPGAWTRYLGKRLQLFDAASMPRAAFPA